MLIALTALHTGTGVTTTAAALAAAWPGPGAAVVVEADPAGGRLGALLPGDPRAGLVSLSRAVGSPRCPIRLADHTRILPSGVAVIAAPPRAAEVHAALTATTAAPTSAGCDLSLDVVVIADCGVADPDSPAAPLMAGADLLVVVVRTDEVDPLARARLERLEGWGTIKALLLLGQDPTGEIAGTLPIPVAAIWPLDPAAAEAAVAGDRTAARTGTLHAAACGLADTVAGQLSARPRSRSNQHRLIRWWRTRSTISRRTMPTVYGITTAAAAPAPHLSPAHGVGSAVVEVGDAGSTAAAPPAAAQAPEPAVHVLDELMASAGGKPRSGAAPDQVTADDDLDSVGCEPISAGTTDVVVAVQPSAGLVVPAPPVGVAGAGPVLVVQVFGPLRVLWRPATGAADGAVEGGVDITDRLAPRCRELLGLLAVHPGGMSRDALIEALWGPNRPNRAVTVLGNALGRLRAAVSAATDVAIEQILTQDRTRYRLDPTIVTVDYWQFDAAVVARRCATTDTDRLGACTRILDIAAWTPLGADMDTEWIDPVREAARRDILAAATTLARAYQTQDPHRSLQLLETAAEYDPCNEPLWQEILTLHARLGQHAAINHTMRVLTSRLAAIGDKPMRETRELVERLRRQHP